MRHTKPSFDFREDPDVHEWEDGSLWKVKDGSYQRLTGPAPVQQAKRNAGNEIDWWFIVKVVIVILAIFGAISLLASLSDHSIGCHVPQGCYIYIPKK